MLKANKKVTHIDMHRAVRAADNEVGPFVPAEDIPAHETEIIMPAHIARRREALRRTKEKQRKNRRLGRYVLLGAGIAGTGLAAMSYNSKEYSEKLPDDKMAIQEQVQLGEHSVSEVVARVFNQYQPTHVTEAGIDAESKRIVEEELDGSTIVHPDQERFDVWVDKSDK